MEASFIGGVIVAAAILVVALGLTLWLYLKLSAALPTKKLLIEVIVILSTVVIGMIVRMAIYYASLPDRKLVGGVQSFFHDLLASISYLTFNTPEAINDMSGLRCGLLISIYYGVLAYTALVFLSVITVGISYDLYSRIQLLLKKFRIHTAYYVFTSVTKDSIVLAKDIKSRYKSEPKLSRGKALKPVIVFLDDGEHTFSRKNPLHRKLIENGFFHLSDPRVNRKGETVCILRKFNFAIKKKCDVGENYGRIFHIFALADGGDYEKTNAEAVYDDLSATVKKYVKFKKIVKIEKGLKVKQKASEEKNDAQKEKSSENVSESSDKLLKEEELLDKHKNTLNVNLETLEKKIDKLPIFPTIVNYYVLASGEVKYDSYQRRTDEVIKETLRVTINTLEDVIHKEDVIKIISKHAAKNFKVNVFNEATLAGGELIAARKENMPRDCKEFLDYTLPDKEDAYRIAVIGFGKTGQHALEALYTQTANIAEVGDEYLPTQFIADIFDSNMSDLSGAFAYNHPLFRCITSDSVTTDRTQNVLKEAANVQSGAVDVLCRSYMNRKGVDYNQAKAFIDKKMALPVAVMHTASCFGYPFMSGEQTEAAIDSAYRHGVRDFVVSLGQDEKNIAMANILIDSFRRYFLKIGIYDGECPSVHVKIYVNIIEKQNVPFIDWSEDDKKIYSYGNPYRLLSVVPFGYRENMYSYDSLIGDYKDRLYNYGYELLSPINRNIDNRFFDYSNEQLSAELQKLEDRIIKLEKPLKNKDEDKDKGKDKPAESTPTEPQGTITALGIRIDSLVPQYFDKETCKELDDLEETLNMISDQFEYNDSIPEYEKFLDNLSKNIDIYRGNEEVTQKWLGLDQFKRLSNRSARQFAIFYYKFKESKGGAPLTARDYDFLQRVEHERWNRFHICNGWVYADYGASPKFTAALKTAELGEKTVRRSVKQHNCLCPYDEMLNDTTKKYDKCNVDLGMVEEIVFDKPPKKAEAKPAQSTK